MIGIVLIVGILSGGWVLSLLWRWIVVSQFGVAPLSLWGAISIKILITYLGGSGKFYTWPDDAETPVNILDKCGRALAYQLLWGALAIGTAWIATHFI